MTLSPILGWSRGIRRAWIAYRLDLHDAEFERLDAARDAAWARHDTEALREIDADIRVTLSVTRKLVAQLDAVHP